MPVLIVTILQMDNPEEGQDNPEEGQDNPEEGQDNPEEGQDNPEEGQDNPEEGQDNPEEGLSLQPSFLLHRTFYNSPGRKGLPPASKGSMTAVIPAGAGYDREGTRSREGWRLSGAVEW